MASIQEEIFQLNTFQNQLSELNRKFEETDENQLFPSAGLAMGSRVLCNYKDGSKVHGRILKIKSDVISVNRDGYESVMNFGRPEVELFSKTKKYEIERQIWLLNKSIAEIKVKIITQSYDFVDFDYEPTLSTLPFEIEITLIDIKKIKDLNIYSIKFKKGKEEAIKNAIVTSPLFIDLKEGNFILKFILGHLVEIKKAKLISTHKESSSNKLL